LRDHPWRASVWNPTFLSPFSTTYFDPTLLQQHFWTQFGPPWNSPIVRPTCYNHCFGSLFDGTLFATPIGSLPSTTLGIFSRRTSSLTSLGGPLSGTASLDQHSRSPSGDNHLRTTNRSSRIGPPNWITQCGPPSGNHPRGTTLKVSPYGKLRRGSTFRWERPRWTALVGKRL
jgi:hypothetical protein